MGFPEYKTNTVQLSKEDEATIGSSEDTEVRREDQEKINRFSRLHQRETVLQENLKAKQVCLSYLFCFGGSVLEILDACQACQGKENANGGSIQLYRKTRKI